ncbi:MAG: hypothetical protein NTY53_10315 [Kiritimatiellaeota bacterium]|nr:hypothetical protein [Kiritimatiellota bacterium]
MNDAVSELQEKTMSGKKVSLSSYSVPLGDGRVELKLKIDGKTEEEIEQEYTKPTEKQLNFARVLGVRSAEKMTRQELSAAIDVAKENAPPAPPTEKQLKYARRLKIENAEMMTARDLSQAIDNVEESKGINKWREERERLETEAEDKAEALANEWGNIVRNSPDDYVLVLLQKPKSISVELVQVESAEAEGTKVFLMATKARVVKEGGVEMLDWSREIEIPVMKIVHYEKIHDVELDYDADKYRTYIAAGERKAESLIDSLSQAVTVPDVPHRPAKIIVPFGDISFNCPSCAGSLVVDGRGAGLQVPCPHCRQQITIPQPS